MPIYIADVEKYSDPWIFLVIFYLNQNLLSSEENEALREGWEKMDIRQFLSYNSHLEELLDLGPLQENYSNQELLLLFDQ